MNGWFAVGRDIFDHPIFEKRPDRIAVWLWLNARAAYMDTHQNAKGVRIPVKRGQLVTSLKKISEETGVGIQVVRTLLDRLKNQHEINTETNTGKLLITICNYDEFQNTIETPNTETNTSPNTDLTRDQHAKETNITNKQDSPPTPPGGQQVTSIEKKKQSDRARGTRLPDDWKLNKKLGEYGLQQGLTREEVIRQSEIFKDHWKQTPGTRGRKCDWDATWRNWIRRAADDRKRDQNRRSSGNVTPISQDYFDSKYGART